jgi:hypothetical protein
VRVAPESILLGLNVSEGMTTATRPVTRARIDRATMLGR